MALTIGWLAVTPVLAPARAATTGTVKEQGSEFAPRQIEVKAGDTVVWIYESGPNNDGHAVKFDNGPDLSPTCSRGLLGGLTGGCQDRGNPTVQRTFTSTDLQGRAQATFPYYCKIHGGPGGQGMSGVVIVTAAATTTTTTAGTTSSTLARATTTSSTAKTSTSSSITSTSRELATSSTLVRSTTTTADTTSVLLPGDAPSLSGDGTDSAAGSSGGSDGGSDSGTVILIVGLLLAVSVGGGYLLWRLRPGRA